MKKTAFKKERTPWNKGKKMSAEYKEKCRKRTLGTKQSEETRKKRSDSLKNHIVTKEAREKIGLSKMKPIILVNLETKEEKTYNQISNLAKELNVCQSSLCRPLKTGKIYKNKYIIKYANTEVSN